MARFQDAGKRIPEKAARLRRLISLGARRSRPEQTGFLPERDRDFYRFLIEYGPDLTGVLNPDGNVRFLSPAVLPVLGFTPEELREKSFLDIVHQEDRGAAEESLRRCLKPPGQSDRIELRCLTRDGQCRRLECRLTGLPGVPAVAGVLLNAGEVKAGRRLRARPAQDDRLLRLMLAEENERTKVAANLHDDLCQILAVACMKLDMMRQGGVPHQAQVDEVKELLEQSHHAVRSIIFQLGSSTIPDEDLASALENVASDMQRFYGLKVGLRDNHRPKPLSRGVRLALLRSVRELLINVAKHAGTDSAHVEVCSTESEIIIRVSDNGVGFAPGESETWTRGGYGLMSIRERMNFIGGGMEVRSAPAQGTTISLTAPLEQDSLPRPESKDSRLKPQI